MTSTRDPSRLSDAQRQLLRQRLAQRRASRIPRRPTPGPVPVSSAQEWLWFFEKLRPETGLYNLARALRLKGEPDRGALARSLQALTRRHEILRTGFEAFEGIPRQVISPRVELEVPFTDLSDLSPEQRREQLPARVSEEARQSFDLTRAPLLRARLWRLEAEEHLLQLTFHHLVIDGWSLGVLLRELGELYPAFAAGREPRLPELPIQFADYAVWERDQLAGDALEGDLEYWKTRLAGELPRLDLPQDRPKPAQSTLAGATLPLELDAGLSAALGRLAAAAEVSRFTVILAGWAALLARLSGSREVLVGTPAANRQEPETEGLIGFLVNTLLLRVTVGTGATARQLLAHAQEVSLEALRHQSLPFARVVEELAPRRSVDPAPLFQTELTYQNVPNEELRLPGDTPVAMEVPDRGITGVELMLEIEDTDGRLTGDLTYSSEIFDRSSAERIVRRFRALLEAMSEHPDRPLEELSLMEAAERRQLETWSLPRRRLEEEPPLPHRLVAVQAAERPDAPALLDDGAGQTYGELLAGARRLAHRLHALGVGPGVPVGVFLEASPQLVGALLACFEAGGMYVPLDPESPPERLTQIVEDAGLRLAVTRRELAARLPAGCEALVLAESDDAVSDALPEPLPASPPESPAYVVFTSGSTGRPKGVVVPYRSLALHCAAMAADYGLGPGDRVLQFTAPVFDAALEQTLPPLAAGAALVLRGPQIWGPKEVLDHLRRHRLTAMDLPPALWLQVLEEVETAGGEAPWGDLRLLILGGDVFPAETLPAWHRRGAPEIRVINAYGPTETTVTSTAWELPWERAAAGLRRVPIGRPTAGRTAQVLDRRLERVPSGVPGELVIGGEALANGYFRRPRLTAEHFVPDPFSRTPGGRMYRTGDRVRHLSGGDLEFLGRIDHQIKVRGFRVEIGEIEAALTAQPAVREAAVTVHEDGGDRRLVAYLSGSELSAPELRQALRQRLPEYMLPAAFVALEALPKNAAGKVDRQALPAPDFRRDEPDEGFIAPSTSAEEVVAGIWTELLGVDRVSPGDNFFDLGGHSLHATRHMHRLEELLGVTLHVPDLFVSQTLEELSRRAEEQLLTEVETLQDEEVERQLQEVDADQPLAAAAWEAGSTAWSVGAASRFAAVSPERRKLLALRLRRALDRNTHRESIPRRGDRGPAPLSWSQEILWYVENQATNPPSIYRFSTVLDFDGLLDEAALERTFDTLAQRHEILRTRFGARPDGTSFQQVEPNLSLEIDKVDLSHLEAEERLPEARRRIEEQALIPFDLTRAPLLRPLLVKLDEEHHWLLLSIHHIIIDDWAFGVLFNEMSELYNAYTSSRPPQLQELPIQYADYAVWERERLTGEYFERLASYWHGRFADGLPQIRLATDRPRPPLPSYRASMSLGRIPEELTDQLRRRSRREDVSLFMILLAAFKILLARHSDQRDVMVACANANRPRAEAEKLLGSFFNLMLLRDKLEPDSTLRQLLAQVRTTALDAYAHQDFPFILVAPGIQPEGLPPGKPPIQALFTFQNTPPSKLRFHGLKVEVVPVVDHVATDLDLLLSIRDDGDVLEVALIYDSDILFESTAERFQEGLREVLEQIAHHPDCRLAELLEP